MKILCFRSSEKILNLRVLSNDLLELGGPLVQVSESLPSTCNIIRFIYSCQARSWLPQCFILNEECAYNMKI